MLRFARLGSCIRGRNGAQGVASLAVNSRSFSQFIGNGHGEDSSVATRTNETIVFKSNSKLPWYMGKGAAVQVYAAAALSAQIVYTMPETASYLEIIASAGPLASTSAFLFFGTKYMCERIITELSVCRTIGQRDEFLKFTVSGIFAPKTFQVHANDLRLINKDEKGMCSVKIHRTTFWLDTGKAGTLESKTLDIILSGKPVLTRWGDKRQKPKKSK